MLLCGRRSGSSRQARAVAPGAHRCSIAAEAKLPTLAFMRNAVYPAESVTGFTLRGDITANRRIN